MTLMAKDSIPTRSITCQSKKCVDGMETKLQCNCCAFQLGVLVCVCSVVPYT